MRKTKKPTKKKGKRRTTQGHPPLPPPTTHTRKPASQPPPYLPTVGVGEVPLAEDDPVEGKVKLHIDRHAFLLALHVQPGDGGHVGHRGHHFIAIDLSRRQL